MLSPPMLLPLFDLEAVLAAPMALTSPEGLGRRIVEVREAHASGRIAGRLAGAAAADWLRLAPELGLAELDVRLTLRTPDEALIYVQYCGRMRLGASGAEDIVAAPRFETASQPWLWVNSVQAIGRGTLAVDGRTIHYRFYELGD